MQKGHPLIAQPSTQSTPHADCTVYLTGVKYLKPKAVDGETLQRARVALGFSLSGVKDTENFGMSKSFFGALITSFKKLTN